MKYFLKLLVFTIFLASCNTFQVAPQPYPVWTTFPTQTPLIITTSPIPLTQPPQAITATLPIATSTLPPIISTDTATVPPTNPIVQSVQVDIIGCNTSIDILHGMGEVTNAYITVKNTGNVDLPNTCSLLRAIDEDREHPDKKACIPNLPTQSQVTLKLTVDSAYQQDTIIQVDTSSNDILLLRVDKMSCRDISLFGGVPSDIGIIKSAQ